LPGLRDRAGAGRGRGDDHRPHRRDLGRDRGRDPPRHRRQKSPPSPATSPPRRPRRDARRLPEPDILVNNAGGPPHGDFREWTIEDWQKAVNANMLTPIMLIKATVDGMCARKFGRIVNITSGSVKSPIPNLGMSNGARAGLTGFVGGLARQVAKHNVTINGLLPGPFLTDRLRSGIELRGAAAERLVRGDAGQARLDEPDRPGRRSRRVRLTPAPFCAPPPRLYRRPEPAARRRRLQFDDGLTWHKPSFSRTAGEGGRRVAEAG